MIDIGQRVEILPAYSSETGAQTIEDEIACCEAVVLSHGTSGYHLVRLRNGEEHEVYVTRLRWLGRIG